MELNILRDARRSDPFRPFAIRTTDGRTLRVRAPESVAIGPNIAIVIKEDDALEMLDPSAIDSLDFAPNGSEPKRKRRRGRGDKS